MGLARLTALVVTALLVGACGSLSELASVLPTDGPGGGPTEPAQPTPRPTDSLPPTPMRFSTCEIVPLADVQALSPLRTPFAYSEPERGNEDTCRYQSSIEPLAEWPNSILLTLRDLGTAEAALAVVEEFRTFELERDRPVDAVTGLGDKAFSTTEDPWNAIVEASKGRYWAHIEIDDSGNLEFPQVPVPGKVAAGVEIIRLALSRIP